MAKIFISHATSDARVATALMDMLQTQFNLTRDDFFYTSDEELRYGDNWIEAIRQGMNDANIVMVLITPSYLESQFCLCELGAAWINKQALVPVIIPPLDHTALDNTPYRSWMQSLTLNSLNDLTRLAQEMVNRGVGHFNAPRFNSRAEEFYKNVLTPFVQNMRQRESITPAVIKALKIELSQYKEAFEMAEEEAKKLLLENEALREMKDAEEVKAMDYANMDDWETFMEAVEKARQYLNPLSVLATSVLYHAFKGGSPFGFVGHQDDLADLRALENQGVILWHDGWIPDYEHPTMERARQAIGELDGFIDEYRGVIQNRFYEEYGDVRLGLKFTPFWLKVLEQRVYNSQS